MSRKASSWNREEKIPKTVEIKAIGHGKNQAKTPVGLVQRRPVQARGRNGLYLGIRHVKGSLKTEWN